MGRIAITGFSHETNTFSPVPATVASFREGGTYTTTQMLDGEPGADSTVGGFVRGVTAAGHEPVPLFFANCQPRGRLDHETTRWLFDSALSGLRSGDEFDGVLLALHGACAGDQLDPVDVTFVHQVRVTVGPDVPIGVVFDLHGNLSPSVTVADIVMGYRTNPHVDAGSRAETCARWLCDAVDGTIRPVSELVQVPCVPEIDRQNTNEGVMLELGRLADELVEADADLLDVTIFQGFPYADVPDMGMSVAAVANASRPAAAAAATRLAEAIVARRDELLGTAVEIAAVMGRTPSQVARMLLLDTGDNVGAGSSADSTALLRAALEAGETSLVQTLCDSESVSECHRAGVDAQLDLYLGGRLPHSPCPPLEVSVVVERIGRGPFRAQGPVHGGVTRFDPGAWAVVRLDHGPTVVISELPVPNTTTSIFTHAGVDPADFRVVVAKGVNGPLAAFGPLVDHIHVVDTPGITRARFVEMTFHARRRPLFPFEDIALDGTGVSF